MYTAIRNQVRSLHPPTSRGTMCVFLEPNETIETHKFTDIELEYKRRGQLAIFDSEYWDI